MLQERIAQAAAARTACDGYTDYSRPIVCRFQAQVEYQGNCDYRALRLTLLRARDSSFNVSMETLKHLYNAIRQSKNADGIDWLVW